MAERRAVSRYQSAVKNAVKVADMAPSIRKIVILNRILH
jgi:hypothetical protein